MQEQKVRHAAVSTRYEMVKHGCSTAKNMRGKAGLHPSERVLGSPAETSDNLAMPRGAKFGFTCPNHPKREPEAQWLQYGF